VLTIIAVALFISALGQAVLRAYVDDDSVVTTAVLSVFGLGVRRCGHHHRRPPPRPDDQESATTEARYSMTMVRPLIGTFPSSHHGIRVIHSVPFRGEQRLIGHLEGQDRAARARSGSPDSSAHAVLETERRRSPIS
jgi:hypothetical protein